MAVMYDDLGSGGAVDEPAQKFLYQTTGKLYRYLAEFSGEDPDEIEMAYHESFKGVTAGADPVLIGDAIGDGIALGVSLAERRRALRQYHDDVVRRELAPPAFDTERIVDGDGDLIGLRVLVSEPDCQFITSTKDEPELFVRTPEDGGVAIPLEFEPGAVEPIDSGESVSEVIVRLVDRSSPDATEEVSETPREQAASDDSENETDEAYQKRDDEKEVETDNDDCPPDTKGGAEE